MPGSATVTIRDKSWSVQIAASPEELTAGLGGLSSIPANTGMLFDLGSEQTVEVTTEPMLFNIDIIFISEDLKVVDVVSDVAPGYLVTEDTPVRYFLEVNAGEAEGIEAGDSVEITDYQYTPPSTISQWMPTIIGVATLGFVGAMVGGVASGVFWHHSSPAKEIGKRPELTSPRQTVTCPICGEVIEIPEWDKVSRSEALQKHLEKVKHEPEHHSSSTSPGAKYKVWFIGGCKVVDGLCHTHGYSVSKVVRCPDSELTQEEWEAAWELAHEAFPHGQSNPWVNGWWPETVEKAEQAVAEYARKMSQAAEVYAMKMHKAIDMYRRSADKAIYNYRQYVMREYEAGKALKVGAR
jgi:uncharacterized membrane protein (UPF0127 family)